MVFSFNTEEDAKLVVSMKVTLSMGGADFMLNPIMPKASNQIIVYKRSRATVQMIMEQLARAFPRDDFTLFQALISETELDNWGVEFSSTPKEKNTEILFPEMDKGKGLWSSKVFPVLGVCPFCNREFQQPF